MPNMQGIESEPRGTWWQRWLIAIFSLALTLLFFWALGFILQDIGRLPGPDWSRLSGDRLDPVMAATTTRLEEEQAGIKRKLENEERRRQVLRDSTATSQKTLGQLLELQRMSLEQKSSLPEAQQQALAQHMAREVDRLSLQANAPPAPDRASHLQLVPWLPTQPERDAA